MCISRRIWQENWRFGRISICMAQADGNDPCGIPIRCSKVRIECKIVKGVDEVSHMSGECAIFSRRHYIGLDGRRISKAPIINVNQNTGDEECI